MYIMCDAEQRMLRLLDRVQELGLCAATLPENRTLYNELAEAMLDFAGVCVRCGKGSQRQTGEPADHFKDELVMNALRYLDPLLLCPPDMRGAYFRKMAQNCFRSLCVRYGKYTRKMQQQDELLLKTAAAEDDSEQQVADRAVLNEGFRTLAEKLTPFEFCAYFYIHGLGAAPREVENLLRFYTKTELLQTLVQELCRMGGVSEAAFRPVFAKQERRGGVDARAVTQAANRAQKKIAKLLLR